MRCVAAAGGFPTVQAAADTAHRSGNLDPGACQASPVSALVEASCACWLHTGRSLHEQTPQLLPPHPSAGVYWHDGSCAAGKQRGTCSGDGCGACCSGGKRSLLPTAGCSTAPSWPASQRLSWTGGPGGSWWRSTAPAAWRRRTAASNAWARHGRRGCRRQPAGDRASRPCRHEPLALLRLCTAWHVALSSRFGCMSLATVSADHDRLLVRERIWKSARCMPACWSGRAAAHRPGIDWAEMRC